MEDYKLLIDLHKRAKRQGPGGDTETEKAVGLAMIGPSAPLKITDIGCGTGSSAMLLSRLLNAKITAVDFLPEFLEMLEANARNLSLTEKYLLSPAQWTSYHLAMRNMTLSGLKERYIILVLKRELQTGNVF